ncbi:unnamed protein product [Amoebophrya sp. A120]|nr:unnamed protein product [Amoebophrya sp. A120]|eukprot:GSA120T00001820001.1
MRMPMHHLENTQHQVSPRSFAGVALVLSALSRNTKRKCRKILVPMYQRVEFCYCPIFSNKTILLSSISTVH